MMRQAPPMSCWATALTWGIPQSFRRKLSIVPSTPTARMQLDSLGGIWLMKSCQIGLRRCVMHWMWKAYTSAPTIM